MALLAEGAPSTADSINIALLRSGNWALDKSFLITFYEKNFLAIVMSGTGFDPSLIPAYQPGPAEKARDAS